MRKVQLSELSQARSGDKGNSVNVALFAPNEEIYNVFKREVTAEKVKEHFAEFVEGDVIRYEAPNLLALNFLCKEALNGGGSSSLRVDGLGKTFSSNLQRMYIEVEEELLEDLAKN
ncbi:hypothetical protein DCC39_03890 [Pueribacillus theae]|uniref:AtuA-like ferredoxin-fold domain-containing protein n=1 Tax=Pueribacillus theae TaxID=2171751 RepID=A0A2U1K7E0_9BACI|nr:hypothetical protein [Pueribacillus theae]PWA12798.1 hypothetical protein DCC39_03890 [Pueribacillus theae]